MSIELTRSSLNSEHFVAGDRHTWPIRIVATSNLEGLPSEIFVWHVGAADSVTDLDPYPGDLFECIASVHQLSSIPANDPETPGPDSQNPFYRTNVLFFHCLSLKDADELWANVQDDVLDLIENWQAAQNLVDDETVTITSDVDLPVD